MNKVVITIFKQGLKIVSKSSAERNKFLTPDIIIYASDKVLYFSFPNDFSYHENIFWKRKPRANCPITLGNDSIQEYTLSDNDLNNIVHRFINQNMVLMAAILETKMDALKLYLYFIFIFGVVLLWFCSKLNITVII